MEDIIKFAQDIETLYLYSKVLDESKNTFKSESTRAYNAGVRFAYENVREILHDYIKNYDNEKSEDEE